jgi:hypothetical protein
MKTAEVNKDGTLVILLPLVYEYISKPLPRDYSHQRHLTPPRNHQPSPTLPKQTSSTSFGTGVSVGYADELQDSPSGYLMWGKAECQNTRT